MLVEMGVCPATITTNRRQFRMKRTHPKFLRSRKKRSKSRLAHRRWEDQSRLMPKSGEPNKPAGPCIFLQLADPLPGICGVGTGVPGEIETINERKLYEAHHPQHRLSRGLFRSH